ncbi:hypothetical protein Tco_1076535 [Tanacetum coccineum]
MLSRMLSRRLEVDQESEMAFELLRYNLEELFIHLKEMDLETTQNNVDYALWDVIENGNSFNPAARTTTNADGTSTSTIPGPVTTKEKAQKELVSEKEKQTIFPTKIKIFKQQDKTARKPVKYAEMYKPQKPRGN